jgi:hypothetical protein
VQVKGSGHIKAYSGDPLVEICLRNEDKRFKVD